MTTTSTRHESDSAIRAAVAAMPLDQIDPSDAQLFVDDTVGHHFERLRREDPVHKTASPIFGDYWSVTKYKDIMHVDTHPAIFSSEWTHGGITLLNPPPGEQLPMFIAMDPPKHDEQRKAVSPIVGPANLASMETLIRERTCAVLDGLPRNETFDWVDRVSIELTTLMLATLFDFPLEDRRLLTWWSDVSTMNKAVNPNALDPQERMAELGKMLGYFTRLWNERVNEPPRNDLVSMLAHGPSTRDMSPIELQPDQRRLLVDGSAAVLGPRAFDVLLALVQRTGQLVSKSQLLELVWPGVIVEENNLQVQISTLRKLLGPDAIATIPGRGYRWVLAQDDEPKPPRAQNVRQSLPAERDEFVGRSEELEALAQRLDQGERLVTILGMAGTGKTRLVRRYALTSLADWPGGVFFCDLSEARSRDGIAFAVAVALDAALGNDDPITQLGRKIAGRGKCLVVLDNFEQVSTHAATTLGTWMEQAGEASFVVTSRVLLAIPGEHVMPLEPLAAGGAGVELFVVRVKARKPDFELTDSNRQVVQQIVTMLDGLPLAIELAAARATVLTPRQLLERLKDRFQVLVGAEGVQARQATLRSAIDWSWTLLAPWEQAALSQASIFVGGFTLEAAEQVLDLSAWPEAPPAIDVVQSLVNKSLLRSWTVGVDKRLAIDEMYFGMYVSIQEYAAEKLRTEGAHAPASGIATAERDAAARHGRYFAQFGSPEAVDALATHAGHARRLALMLEAENFVAACRRAVDRADAPVAVAIVVAMWSLFGSTGRIRPAVELGRQVVALEALGPGERARATHVLASAMRVAGRVDEALRYYQMTLELNREVGNRRGEGRALFGLGDVRRHQGRVEEASQCWQDGLATAREAGDRRNEIACLDGLANLYKVEGRMGEALQHYQVALALAREVGNRQLECHELGNLGILYTAQGRTDEALQCLSDALDVARDAGERRTEGHVLGNLGVLLSGQGRLEDASEHLNDALAIALDSGNHMFEVNIRRDLGGVLLLQDRPADALPHLEQGLARARSAGYRDGEGSLLTCYGRMHTAMGRFDEARDAFAAGDAILLEAGEKWERGWLLSYRSECERLAGDVAAARKYLAQASVVGDELAVNPQSALGRKIASLRAALDGDRRPRNRVNANPPQ